MRRRVHRPELRKKAHSSGRGETGRRKGLKIPRRKACGFDPHRPHHVSTVELRLLGILQAKARPSNGRRGWNRRCPEGAYWREERAAKRPTFPLSTASSSRSVSRRVWPPGDGEFASLLSVLHRHVKSASGSSSESSRRHRAAVLSAARRSRGEPASREIPLEEERGPDCRSAPSAPARSRPGSPYRARQCQTPSSVGTSLRLF